ncbi:extracellular solute-binding protein [Arthrobacter sp. MI7-26]|uniref:ABC transporter substrate-binding protein n=1 Tax=Arthrobacter sp. MI7-26 TaxID=2993653 RepID=UPI00224999F7|nr:extracellular solute-binding protein [Arthrobacter sp. MI7-26]MCX2750457.1 extracellular solute-binding protein [Arthrobacter sp. MI7-26]
MSHVNTNISRRSVIIASGSLALLAAGCSKSTSGPPITAVAAKGPGPGHYKMDLGRYTGPELSTEQITLRLMRQNWNGAADKIFDAQVAAFQTAYPNISVKQELVPYGDLSQKLSTSFAANSAPDIAIGQSALIPSYVYGQMAVPVGDFMTEDFAADMYPDLAQAVSTGGHMYGIPLNYSATMGILYNKELFKSAGITPPPESTNVQDGWTLDQWFETWDKLRSWMDRTDQKSMYPIAPSVYGNGGPGSNYQQVEQTWIRMLGSPDAPKNSDEYKAFAGISDDGRTVSGYVNNALAVEGMRNYQTLFTKRWSPTGNQPNMFESGQAATRFGGIIRPLKFAQGVTPLPRGKVMACSNATDTFIVTTQSKHPAEAAALLAALNTVDVLTKWNAVYIHVPAFKSVTQNLPPEIRTTPDFQLGVAMDNHAYAPPSTPAWAEYNNLMNQAGRNIALGADVSKTLNDTAASINQQLAKYGK